MYPQKLPEEAVPGVEPPKSLILKVAKSTHLTTPYIIQHRGRKTIFNTIALGRFKTNIFPKWQNLLIQLPLTLSSIGEEKPPSVPLHWVVPRRTSSACEKGHFECVVRACVFGREF